MGVEVVGFEMVEGPVESVTGGDKSVLHEKENRKLDQGTEQNETIKFGSHGKNLLKRRRIAYRPFDDPKIKAKIDQAAIEIEKRTQARLKITDALKAKRSDRSELISQIKALKDDNRQFKSIVDEKFKEMEPLQQVLGKLRSANNASRAGGLCSSEEELNSFIYSLNYRIQHESIPLTEEKQLLREIKQLEGTREKVIANAATRAKLQDTMLQKEALQDQVKLIGGDLDGVKKEQNAVRAKIKLLDDAVKAIDKDIAALQDELTAVTEKRDKARESVQHLRKQRDDGNSYFYQSRTLLNKARELAAKKDIKALEDLSTAEVDKFISLWSSDKAFRDDYERRMLPSLDSRQLSRDGRMRNPDEKPLVALEVSAPVQSETLAKPNPKQLKEDIKSLQVEALPAKKVQKEVKTTKAVESKSTLEHIDVADKEIDFEKPQKDTPVRHNEEREKKLKKKAAASTTETNLEDPSETVEEAAEPENENGEASVPVKEKTQKESTARSRYRTKGPESVPKVLLKRKKPTNYWLWAAPVAVLVVVTLVLQYYFLMRK
ncbi:hypothetical protein FNV43_RR16820 [Rhamnella rubrinervis]|uniref:Proton pump-interactor 1 n=1 Tax=Rhamnella rubrinervis TaxID=2594499 RepID=A0A8K0GZH1_9ROSA|nr:hypothetical protein FNV43_RR16820 [Rhamnella rubrinervis]